MKSVQFSLSRIAYCCALSSVAIAAQAEQEKQASVSDVERIAVYGQHYKNYITEQADSATKLGITIKETPQSVSVVSRAMMDDFSLDDINSVLESTPGVTVEQIETDRTYFKARGFDITNFQFDGLGIPQELGDVHGTLDTSIYDRIEIVRGANGLMTGSGNPAATVNMVLKRPSYVNDLSVSASVGSWDKRRFEVDATGAINDTNAVRAVLTKQTSDSYLDRYEKDLTLGYLAYEGQITPDTKVSLSYTRQSKDADSPLWGALPLFYDDGSATNFDVSTSTASDWAYWNNDNENIIAEVEHFISATWLVRARYAHLTNEQESELFYVYGTPSAETGLGLTGYGSAYDYKDQQNLYDIYASGDFSAFGQTHNLAFGISYADLNYRDSSLYDYTTGNGFPALPALEEFDGNVTRPTFTDDPANYPNGSNVQSNQESAYVTARFKLADPFAVIVGARYTEWQSEGISYDTSKEKSAYELIPYLGAVYDFGENYSVYASYTETFTPQSELGADNTALDPFTGKSAEIGFKAQLLDDKLFATFAVFDAEQNGKATELPGQEDVAVGDRRSYGADYTSEGFEVELSGRLSDDLSTSVSYSYVNIDGDTQFDDQAFANSVQLVEDYTPESQIKLAFNYEVPVLEGLALGANYRWQDSTSRVQVRGADNAPLVTTKQGAYGLLDLVASYQFSENISAAFNINNVTDEKYLHSLYWAQGYYGAPRNYSLSVNWQL